MGMGLTEKNQALGAPFGGDVNVPTHASLCPEELRSATDVQEGRGAKTHWFFHAAAPSCPQMPMGRVIPQPTLWLLEPVPTK